MEIWQDGIRFALAVYKATADFPKHEQFGLTSQLQRAAVSIPSNIAEGHAHISDAVFARHLQIAIGSAAEADTQLLIAQQLGYLSLEQMQDLRASAESLIRCMRSLHRQLIYPQSLAICYLPPASFHHVRAAWTVPLKWMPKEAVPPRRAQRLLRRRTRA